MRAPTLAEVQRTIAQRSLARFIFDAWHIVEPATPLIWNWHIDAIAEHLEAVTRGRIQNLLINIPPGHLKSLIVSVFWPCWEWVEHGDVRWLFASYAADLAIRDSVKCRGLIESDWYQQQFSPSWRMAADQNAKSYFENTDKGFRAALSVGGKTTGFRGRRLVVDDPLNALDQFSKPAIEQHLLWWDQSFANRVDSPQTGSRVVIMQRLHEQDLSGHLLAQGGWDHLCLPSEYEPERRAKTSIGWEDPRTEPGELLFPAMFSRTVLDQEKRRLGSSGYAGQHQQRPAPATGDMIKRGWFKRYEQAPVLEEVVQSWDCSFKDSAESDFVVGQVWGRVGANKYLLDQVRARMDLPATMRALKDLRAKWPATGATYVEDKANGTGVMQVLRDEVPGLIPVNPEGGKIARLAAVSPQIEAGNVFIPDKSEWVGDFIEECAVFPRGAHDDQVDAMSQVLLKLGRTQDFWILT